MSDARTDIFARVRHGTSGASAESVAAELAGIGAGPAAALPCDEPCTAFLTNVLRNQGTIDIARNRSETVKAVADYLYQRYRSHKIVAGSDTYAMDGMDLRSAPTNTCSFGNARTNLSTRSRRARRSTITYWASTGMKHATTITKSKTFHGSRK